MSGRAIYPTQGSKVSAAAFHGTAKRVAALMHNRSSISQVMLMDSVAGVQAVMCLKLAGLLS